MMLKSIIILDDEGISLKLHLQHGQLLTRRVARYLKSGEGGCFGGVTTNWDSLHLIGTVFYLKLGEDQKINLKKGLCPS